MEKATIKVINKSGLHARPAATFVSMAQKFKSSLKINANDKTVNGKSIVALLSAGISCNSEIELIADGEDEKAALEALTQLLEQGCGECA